MIREFITYLREISELSPEKKHSHDRDTLACHEGNYNGENNLGTS